MSAPHLYVCINNEPSQLETRIQIKGAKKSKAIPVTGRGGV
jgi:hypothetical protein